jgi:uncharacterized membrane protein (UPF0136 family)
MRRTYLQTCVQFLGGFVLLATGLLGYSRNQSTVALFVAILGAILLTIAGVVLNLVPALRESLESAGLVVKGQSSKVLHLD